MTGKFDLKTPFSPTGDQPGAIDKLVRGAGGGRRAQVLLGVTGSGKTFTMANVVARLDRPTLVLCHNKTLAAQLYSEFKEFFPSNAVEYFVSYYDYYQPEAYIPQTDTFIEKDAQINDEIDKLRHSATRSLLERRDVLIVSSVSCIYGLGSPEVYEGMRLALAVGDEIKRQELLRKLVEMQYKRNDVDFHRGTFRVRGDMIEVFPAYEEERAVRIELFGDEIEGISIVDPLRGIRLERIGRMVLFPSSHYVTTAESRKRAIESIRIELRGRLQELKGQEKLVEAQRLEQRTLFDLEMMEELGYCQGIENYSRHLTGRRAGEAPPTLIDYFPDDFLLVVDESHVTVPQLGAMYRGDRSRKTTLVEHGFRLPSALDNRPLDFKEWEAIVNQVVFVSATPGDYELAQSGGEVVEQVIRPTGLLDPEVEIRPAGSQVDDLFGEVRKRAERGERVLVTTLTKRLAEDLSRHYQEQGVKVKYLHSDIETLERIEILRDLRLGTFDVLVGINLLREGLDLPEVSLVAILDADKEGFLRSTRSLIQTMGRAARNASGRVIMYADRVTDSMRRAVDETVRRRKIQSEYNDRHGITPRTVVKAVRAPVGGAGVPPPGEKTALERDGGALAMERLDLYDPRPVLERVREVAGEYFKQGGVPVAEMIDRALVAMEKDMRSHAGRLEFEKAAALRDKLRRLRRLRLEL